MSLPIVKNNDPHIHPGPNLPGLVVEISFDEYNARVQAEAYSLWQQRDAAGTPGDAMSDWEAAKLLVDDKLQESII